MAGCALLCVLAVFAMQALAVQAISPSVGSSAKHPKPIRRALRVRRASSRPVCCGRHSGMRMCADVEGALAVERVYVRLDGVAAAELANAAAAAGEQQLWPAQAWEAGAGAAMLVISPARRVVVLNDSSPAAAAGLRLLDVLVAVDGERTPSLSKARSLSAAGAGACQRQPRHHVHLHIGCPPARPRLASEAGVRAPAGGAGE